MVKVKVHDKTKIHSERDVNDVNESIMLIQWEKICLVGVNLSKQMKDKGKFLSSIGDII